MMERQNADGTISGLREYDTAEMYKLGGSRGPAGSNVPSFEGGGTLSFNIAGGTDTAGGILSWQNNLGYDIIVTGHQLDVTTQSSGACTVSIGQTATNGTTSSSNMINGQTVAAAGIFNGGALSVIVHNGDWITGSKASGASAALVGAAIFQYVRRPAAGKA